MTIKHFIDAYAQDIALLKEARDALLTHPKVHVSNADASFCRILTVLTTGSIETVLKSWKGAPSLAPYFQRNTENGERIRVLSTAFTKAGVHTDEEILKDFLAIKYLRNAIVHGGWKDTEEDKKWMEARGFPTDLDKLAEVHWHKIARVATKMLQYIQETVLFPASVIWDESLNETLDLQIAFSQSQNTSPATKLLRKADLPQLYWSNLEKIDMDMKEGKNESSYLGECALESWREYCNLTLGTSRITIAGVDKATEILEHLHQRGVYPKVPIGIRAEELLKIESKESELIKARELLTEAQARGDSVSGPLWEEEWPQGAAVYLIKYLMKGYEPLAEEDIIAALITGNRIHRTIRNITPLTLFLIKLPELDPGRAPEYLEEGKKALAYLKLSDYWYSYVESVGNYAIKPNYEQLTAYEAKAKELENRLVK